MSERTSAVRPAELVPHEVHGQRVGHPEHVVDEGLAVAAVQVGGLDPGPVPLPIGPVEAA